LHNNYEKTQIELEHTTLITKFLEEQIKAIAIVSLSREPNKKQTHVTPNAISSFLLLLLEVYKGLMPKLDDCPNDSFVNFQELFQ
jgi:hypothetical protein